MHQRQHRLSLRLRLDSFSLRLLQLSGQRNKIYYRHYTAVGSCFSYARNIINNKIRTYWSDACTQSVTLYMKIFFRSIRCAVPFLSFFLYFLFTRTKVWYNCSTGNQPIIDRNFNFTILSSSGETKIFYTVYGVCIRRSMNDIIAADEKRTRKIVTYTVTTEHAFVYISSKKSRSGQFL